MFGLGTTELIIIGIILLLIFGAKRLPEIGKGLGGAIREFRKVKRDIGSDRESQEENKEHKEKNSAEKKLTEKIINDIPALRKSREIKEQAEKIKDIIK